LTDAYTDTHHETEPHWWWRYSPALAAAVILAVVGIFAAATAVWGYLHPPPDCEVLMQEYVAAFEDRLREPGAAMEPGDGREAYERLEEAGCVPRPGDTEL